MNERILLVTGSRALVGSDRERTARTMLRALVFALPDESIVVAGDAPGPDAWAIESAMSSLLALRHRVFALDGWVYNERRERAWQWTHASAYTPLDRNEAMVRAVARRRAHGADVEVIGLEAPWSRTKGTAHTLRIASESGLRITRVSFEQPSTVDNNRKL